MWEKLGVLCQPILGTINAAMEPLKPSFRPITLPTETSKGSPTQATAVDSILSSLQSKKQEWSNKSAKDRAKLVRKCIEVSLKAVESAADLMVAAKGSYGNGKGEERSLLLTPICALREFAESLEAGGQLKPKKLYKRPDGQWCAEVFPAGIEGMFFAGYKGEIWIEPGKEPTQGMIYRELNANIKLEGSVGLVLGAGNQISVLILDILHMLLVENSVAICKFNPVLDYLGPFAEQLFEPFISEGYVAFIYGGAAEGRYICQHQLVDKIHLTGSAATYDAIVWDGLPKEGEPKLKKAVTAELGCVTPYIVTPGVWSTKAIHYYADECVSGLISNSGHNCTKLEVLITAQGWPQREEFVAAVRDCLNKVSHRVAWYSGSKNRYAAFKEKFPDAEELGRAIEAEVVPGDSLPWLFKSGLSPAEADTQTENWVGVLQEVAIPDTGSDPGKFLEAAVKFANDRCWGSLSCSVIAPPQTSAAALDKAVADLRYGSININLPSFVGYTLPKLSWGAFPGQTPQEIGSGTGHVHNTLLFDYPQKSVVGSAWIHHPTHLWSSHVKNLDVTTLHAKQFMAAPNLFTLTRTALAAIRG